VQPLMLNKLIHGSLGFQRAVLASAGFNLGLLLIAMVFLRTRLPPNPSRKEGSLAADFKKFMKEPTYVLTVLGYVQSTGFYPTYVYAGHSRTFTMLLGLYFPIFFLQLNAISKGIDGDTAFYLVRPSILFGVFR
jgi:hypothetical protein